MSLPILNTAKQIITVPSSGKQFKVRPWLVGEEKALLMAKESDDPVAQRQAIINMIEACVEGASFDSLSSSEFEYLFLMLRKISVNNVIEIGVKHEKCGHINPIQIDLNKDIILTNIEKDRNKILLDESQSIGVVMREPTSKDFENLATFKTKTEKAFHMIRSSIESIYDAETVYDPKEFSSTDLNNWINSLNREQLNRIQDYFEKLPQVSVNVEYACESCGEQVKQEVRGLDNFL